MKQKKCIKCYGKGYATVYQGDTMCMADFISDKTYRIKKAGFRISLCNCNRGGLSGEKGSHKHSLWKS